MESKNEAAEDPRALTIPSSQIHRVLRMEELSVRNVTWVIVSIVYKPSYTTTGSPFVRFKKSAQSFMCMGYRTGEGQVTGTEI